MKTLITLLSFIIGMMVNAQVSQTQVFATTEEIHFVSDDGGGMYTVSGPGAGDDGFLAIYDEGSNSWEVKNFPAKTNLGTVHNAEVDFAYTLGDGTTIAKGIVANSSSTSWHAIRKYQNGTSGYSQEEVIQANIVVFPPADGKIYAQLSVGNSGYAWNLGSGNYFIKINAQNLSLDWAYQLPQGTLPVAYDPLISTAKVYRYAVQALPNGNIAVHVIDANGIDELWEFNPNTGQKLGVIDDSNTDYDRDGVVEMQYRFHRWKVVDGVLFHEFWNDPNNSQDAQIGHWEKLEVPSYTPGGSTAWEPANLQVTAVSNWGNNDSFRTPVDDFYVDSNGMIHWYGRSMTEKFALYKNEVDHSGALNGLDVRDEWVNESGETMMMTPHSLVRVMYGEQFSNHIEAVAGNNVVEARNDQVYHDGWHQRAGEATIVVEHSAMPQVGDTPDASWWSIPSGFHFEGAFPIKMETRPGDEDYGKLYFDVGALEDNQPSTPSELILRVWVVDANTVSVQEMEVSGLKLYPNPVQDYLTVSADDGIDTVRIYNLLGVIVSESNLNSVYTGNLAHGVYIAEVISGDKMSRKKIIKK